MGCNKSHPRVYVPVLYKLYIYTHSSVINQVNSMSSFTVWVVQNDIPEFIYQERSNGNKKAIYH